MILPSVSYRLEWCIVTIASLEQWLPTIENHRFRWLTVWKTIEKQLVPMVELVTILSMAMVIIKIIDFWQWYFLLSFLVEAEIKQKKCCYICALTHRNNWEHHFWYPGTIFFSKIHHILIYWVFLVLCWMLHVCICGFCIFVFQPIWDTW